MKVTRIVRQLKNQDRCSIYIDGDYCFSLSSNALLESKLSVGDELDDQGIASYKALSEIDKIYGRVLALISRRMRSTWEIQDYLKRKNVVNESSAIILNKLTKLGYVDDEDFARRWVESRRLLKSVSLRKLRLELMAKHVPGEIIDRVLQADETNETDVLKELVIKKRSMSHYQDDQKLMQYLTRQGFNYSDIKDVLQRIEIEQN